jgi:hypothetical protein
VNGSDLAKAQREVKAPASWLVATGILNWIALLFIIAAAVDLGPERFAFYQVLLWLAALFLSTAIILAGLKMKRLEAYSLAITGSILALFITPGNIIGLPVGIWSLVVLCRREVREAFGKAHLLPTAEPPQRRRLGLAWIAAALVCGIALGSFGIVQFALHYKRRDGSALLNTIGSVSSEGGIGGVAQSAGPVPGASLSSAQIEAYVAQNKRNAESLLAAYRMSANVTYLQEAARKFPGDRDVQYAVIAAKAFPAAQRQWIDAYKASSPDNALAWYFSALEYFRVGQTKLAVQELAEATRKPAFRVDLAPMLEAVEEMNLSAGRKPFEAKMVALAVCAFAPPMAPMKELANAMRATTEQYRQHGDSAAAEALAGMGLVLGHHLEAGGGSQTIMSQLVGVAIGKMFMRQLDPNSRDPLGRRVGEVSAALEQHGQTLKSDARTLSRLTPRLLTTAEAATYMERVKLYGEETALSWLKAKWEEK